MLRIVPIAVPTLTTTLPTPCKIVAIPCPCMPIRAKAAPSAKIGTAKAAIVAGLTIARLWLMPRKAEARPEPIPLAAVATLLPKLLTIETMLLPADLTAELAPLTPLVAFFLKRLNGLNDFKKLKALKPATRPTKPVVNAVRTPDGRLATKFPIAATALEIHVTTVPMTVPSIDQTDDCAILVTTLL